jgi:hypothetical protein
MANIYHAACWLLAGSVAAPVWSQSAIDPDQPSTPSHPEIEAVAPSGERAPELVDALIEVSDQYQNEGQHFLADAAIERALEITRINYGLYSLEQIPLIQRSIDNESARDNPVGVWDREQQLIELADRNPDDPRIVPILTEMAGKRVDILERYLEGEYPPEIVLGCYYRRGNHNYSGCTGGSSRVVSETLFFEALRYYDDAIGTLVRNEAQSSPERLQLEHAALQMIYEFADLIFPPSRYELG